MPRDRIAGVSGSLNPLQYTLSHSFDFDEKSANGGAQDGATKKCYLTVLYFGAKSNRRYRRLTENIRDLKFEMGLSPRMHQTSYNRYNPNFYGSL